jgi:glycosyltransferase involved in cell wall biosynthesis
MTLASFVIPVLNEEKRLPVVLDSLQNQKVDDMEIIVVDGGSSDRSVEIAERYGCKVVEVKERGIGLARSVGVKHARGEFVFSCSADAVYPSHWASTLLTHLDDNDVVYGPVISHPDEGVLEYYVSHISFPVLMFLTNFTHLPFVSGDNVAFKKQVVKSVGVFNPRLKSLEDVEFVFRAKRHGFSVKFVKDAYVFTSPRRLKQWGSVKFTLFHVFNYWRAFLTKDFSHAEREYGVVKE